MAGPYKWVKYAPQQSLQLARNDAYYLGKPHIDQVIFLPFANADASLIAMEKGDIDTVQIPITELARFQKLPQLDVLPLKGGVANWISVNTSKPEFADKRFRQAVAYAIDKDTIIRTLWTGLATPLYGHFLQDWAKNPNVNKYAYNPDKAKQLLKDVNWDPNRVIDFTYYYADKQSESLMVAMQSYLGQVGVKTQIRLIDTATVTKEVDKDGTYDWMYGALGVPLDPDQATAGIASDRLYPAGQNRPKWKNAALDAEMKAGRVSLDQSERQKHYYEAERILNDELPYIWLWEPQRPQAVSKRVIGMAQHQGLVYNMSAYRAIHEWWIKA
jgi:peptide/nickel transport system substrate-binding protein